MKSTDRLWAFSFLSIFAALSMGTAWHESATYDEPVHILAGVVGWKTPQLDVDFANPPLARYWQTLPIMLRPQHPFPKASQLLESERTYSFNFLYHSSNSPLWMLQAPRAMNLVLAVLLGWVLFFWTSQGLGSPAARGTLVAYAFSPAMISLGSLATTDLAGALGWILFLFAAWNWLQQPGALRAAMAGAALGAALCMKYSTLLALPASVLAIAWSVWRTRPQRAVETRTLVISAGLALVAANAVMMICFRGWGLPEWLAGFSKLAAPFTEGHAAYYWGRFGEKGWRTYFLTGYLLKTPLPFLLALWTAVVIRRRWTPGDLSFLIAWCLWPVALIFTVSSFSRIQVGIRHILPVVPLLCVVAGAAAAILWESGSRPARGWILLLGLWYAAGTVLVFPRYLSYFNDLVGPSYNGVRYFADSNLDWGQGLGALAKDLRQRGSPPIFFSYFGCADPGQEGIRFQPILMTTCTQVGGAQSVPLTQAPLYFAVSATNRVGLYYQPHGVFAWLDGRKPEKIIMDSIWLYDVTNDPDAKARLKALIPPPLAAR